MREPTSFFAFNLHSSALSRARAFSGCRFSFFHSFCFCLHCIHTAHNYNVLFCLKIFLPMPASFMSQVPSWNNKMENRVSRLSVLGHEHLSTAHERTLANTKPYYHRMPIKTQSIRRNYHKLFAYTHVDYPHLQCFTIC